MKPSPAPSLPPTPTLRPIPLQSAPPPLLPPTLQTFIPPCSPVSPHRPLPQGLIWTPLIPCHPPVFGWRMNTTRHIGTPHISRHPQLETTAAGPRQLFLSQWQVYRLWRLRVALPPARQMHFEVSRQLQDRIRGLSLVGTLSTDT